MTKPRVTCPTCGRIFEADMQDAAMPFCSMRCKMADLNRWFSEEIGMPYEPSDDDPEGEPPPPREIRFD